MDLLAKADRAHKRARCKQANGQGELLAFIKQSGDQGRELTQRFDAVAALQADWRRFRHCIRPGKWNLLAHTVRKTNNDVMRFRGDLPTYDLQVNATMWMPVRGDADGLPFGFRFVCSLTGASPKALPCIASCSSTWRRFWPSPSPTARRRTPAT